ncbi:hypothetical protein, partial [Kocuria nitroreducens]|uniref:hypothetical protein n=1 Tax=Kocuria nitroreducens TaxID=3058914 RepID=UPI0036D934DA
CRGPTGQHPFILVDGRAMKKVTGGRTTQNRPKDDDTTMDTIPLTDTTDAIPVTNTTGTTAEPVGAECHTTHGYISDTRTGARCGGSGRCTWGCR